MNIFLPTQEDSRFASTPLDETASDYVLNLLNQTEEKLLFLINALRDKDKKELLRRIEEVEVGPSRDEGPRQSHDHLSNHLTRFSCLQFPPP